ncbi:MAG TPA: hypothetical protein PKE45_16655 [Caldilineaceae bacterium]|nr:hypothetical protein [Caldilineaceae bacterium]
MKQLGLISLVSFVLVLALSSPAAASDQHIKMQLHSVGGSGVAGFVNLTQLPHDKGTRIVVVASGLHPGNQYVSLYYDNHVCELEPYSPSDRVGGVYTGNGGGMGTTQGNADDDLDEINSVSVRNASDFTLLACADIHP